MLLPLYPGLLTSAFVTSNTNAATTSDKQWGQKAMILQCSLLIVLVVMIAMVMEYQYSNNDLHYAVDDPPYVEY